MAKEAISKWFENEVNKITDETAEGVGNDVGDVGGTEVAE